MPSGVRVTTSLSPKTPRIRPSTCWSVSGKSCWTSPSSISSPPLEIVRPRAGMLGALLGCFVGPVAVAIEVDARLFLALPVAVAGHTHAEEEVEHEDRNPGAAEHAGDLPRHLAVLHRHEHHEPREEDEARDDVADREEQLLLALFAAARLRIVSRCPGTEAAAVLNVHLLQKARRREGR